MAKEVKIAVQAAAYAPLEDFQHFQGELKYLPEENYEALKKSILNLGFSFALSVWFDKEEKMQIIDGHQRVATLKAMQRDGYRIPHLPYDAVDADSYQEAKKKVLAGASQYGTVQHLGLAEFISDTKISSLEISQFAALPGIDPFNLPRVGEFKEVNVNEHTRQLGDEWEGMPEFNQEDKKPIRTIYVHFEKEEDIDIFAKLIQQTITDKTKSLWYPKATIGVIRNKRYKDRKDG